MADNKSKQGINSLSPEFAKSGRVIDIILNNLLALSYAYRLTATCRSKSPLGHNTVSFNAIANMLMSAMSPITRHILVVDRVGPISILLGVVSCEI